MAKTSPAQFVQQVRTEAAKVTWPTRKETMLSTLMVLLMVAFAAVFFFLVDQLMSLGVRQLLQLGS